MADDRRETDELLRQAADRAIEYVSAVRERCVFPTPDALGRLAAFEEPTPEGPTDAVDVLAMLDELGSPGTVATTGGRYFGFVVGGALPIAVASNWLAAAWDQNAALELLSPVASRLERVGERWLLDLLGLPADAAVGFVSGASEANFSALAAARHELLRRAGWDAAERGLHEAPALRVVMSDEIHSSVPRALGLLGIGRRQCERVPVDRNGRVRADALPELDERTIVVVQAGHVSTGAFDPFTDICNAAREAGAWVHVEGAYGAWAAVSERYRRLLDGYELADSWAVDAHKYLNVPYDSGFVICSDREALLHAMDMNAPYILFSEGRDGARLTPVLSRRARAVEVWAAIKRLGRSGIGAIVDRTCALATRLASGLAAAGFEILNDVVLNQVLVAAENDAATEAIARALEADGTCWCSTTTRAGRTAIRVSICSWATTADDIDRTIDAFRRAVDES